MGHFQYSSVQLRTATAQLSTSSSSPDTSGDPRGMRPSTRRSQSDDELSTLSGIESNSTHRQKTDDDKARPKTPRWFTHVKDWLAVSEPSAQAMKEHKRTMHKKHGVDPNDPRAVAKLHFPMGQVPEGAITSTRGPSPEKAYKQRIEREKKLRQSEAGRSVSSSISSVPSSKEANPATPWEN